MLVGGGGLHERGHKKIPALYMRPVFRNKSDTPAGVQNRYIPMYLRPIL
jgi:hypothetical protein